MSLILLFLIFYIPLSYSSLYFLKIERQKKRIILKSLDVEAMAYFPGFVIGAFILFVSWRISKYIYLGKFQNGPGLS